MSIRILLEWTSGNGFKKEKDILLINRNVKMARRMDSLAHIRNSFFAVGAAHLPGDSGVITLLRARGFTVDPVFSSQKITPEKYTYTVKELPWEKIIGPDSAYIVEMPGRASDVKADENVSFKIHADLATNIIFMTGFSHEVNEAVAENAEKGLVKNFTDKGHKKITTKKITKGTQDGIELFSKKDDIFFRIQVFIVTGKLHMMFVGSEKENDLTGKEAKRFLESYTINDNLKVKPKEWVEQKNAEAGFSLSFPKKPSVDIMQKDETAENTGTTTYSYFDLKNATYFIAAMSETKKGFVNTNDSIILNARLNYYKEMNATIENFRIYTHEGLPASSLTASMNKDGIDFVIKMNVIVRGNRSYSIAVIAQKGKEDFPDVTNYFRSFKILPYQQSQWSQQTGPNNAFSTWVPGIIEGEEKETVDSVLEVEKTFIEENEDDKRTTYLAYDKNTATTYHIAAMGFSPYYWAVSDSALLENQLSVYYSDTASFFAKRNPGNFDSLYYKKSIVNGTVKGMEAVVKNAGNNTLKKVRIFVYGDSVYHVFALLPENFIVEKNNEKFFSDFRFKKENITSTLFDSKTKLILKDLESADSTTRSKARQALYNAKFTKADLPLLYAAYFKFYPKDSTSYLTINENISNAISEVKDSSSIVFVKDNYSKIPGTLSELRMSMLKMLAEQKTAASYQLLKQLMLTAPPAKGSPYQIVYVLNDSLALTKTLYPEVAALYADTILGSGLLSLAVDMVDSNMLNKDVLTNNAAGIISLAKKQLDKFEKNEEDYPDYGVQTIKALATINNESAVALLNRFVKADEIYLKKAAVMGLLQNGHPVAATEIKKITNDLIYRVDTYTELKKLNKEQLFPKENLSQEKFAESYLFNSLYDDEVAAPVFKAISSIEVEENSTTNRYFIFKVTYSYDEGEKETYLSFCGPFAADKKQLIIDSDKIITKTFFEEQYFGKNAEKTVKEFLKTPKEAPAEK